MLQFDAVPPEIDISCHGWRKSFLENISSWLALTGVVSDRTERVCRQRHAERREHPDSGEGDTVRARELERRDDGDEDERHRRCGTQQADGVLDIGCSPVAKP